jgi:ATP-dependent Clp protease protease subunit
MNLDGRRPHSDMPQARKHSEEKFSERLAAGGHVRGVRAAKKNEAEGEIRIYDVIGVDFWTGEGVTAPDVAEQLATLKGVSRLNIYINSPGGDLFTGKTVYNQIARCPAHKVVHIDGIAASAASLIAMAGDEIITEPGGTWLVHEVAMGGVSDGRGTAEDHIKTAGELKTETDAILAIYEQRTKCPAHRLSALMREDRIISAAEAKSFGLTDVISEAEQRRADTHAAQAAAARSALSSSDVAHLARIKRRELANKFAGAGPGTSGQPGTTPKVSGDRK